jgi:hypothetical protein
MASFPQLFFVYVAHACLDLHPLAVLGDCIQEVTFLDIQ